MKRILSLTVCAALCFMLALSIAGVFGGAASFYARAELLEIKSHIEKDAGMSQYATVQGACTDGKYAYFAVQESSTVILKYDLKTWKLAKKATVSGLGHANDMTYNARRELIVVANNTAAFDREADDQLTLLDPETLTVRGTVKALRKKTEKELEKERQEAAKNPTSATKKKDEKDDEEKDYVALKVYSVAYQESEDRYVVGLSGGYDFAVLDKDFKQVKQYKGEKTGYTRQGCDCDDDYIYFSQGDGSNIIVIYDFSGKYVDTVSLDHSHEIENLFHAGNDYYLTLHYYGNAVMRVGLSKDKQIRFGVKFDPGSGSGKMQPASVHYGEKTKLPKCTFKKEGYFFGGWLAKREFNGTCMGRRFGSTEDTWYQPENIYDYTLLPDEAKVSQLTRIGDVTLTAFWIREEYEVNFDPGTGEGWMEPEKVAYADVYTLPDNQFTQYGCIFVGYTARRDCDGRVYGYPADSERPRWLEPEDMEEAYLFSQGEQVSRLAFDGTVTFTAQFSSAFSYDEDQSSLLSYIGVDKEVTIPNPTGELNRIAGGAFSDNTIMTELTVPSSVDVIERGALTRCSALKNVLFKDHFPSRFDRESIVDSGVQRLYLVVDAQPVYIGWYCDPFCTDLILRSVAAVNRCAEQNDALPFRGAVVTVP